MASLQRAVRDRKAKLEAVIFDLGGTLMFFDGDWGDVVLQGDLRLMQAVQAAGMSVDEKTFPIRFRTQLQDYYVERETEFIEYTTAYILRQVLAEYGYLSVSDGVVRDVLAAMYTVTQSYWKPDPEAHSALEVLKEKGYRLGLISNAGDDADVQQLLDQARLRPYFEAILTSAAEGIRKPNPKIFWTALNHIETHPSKAAMVGDTLGADILGAQNAGLFSVLVTQYADTPANRAHADTIRPDAFIGRLGELPGLLESTYG
jgi:HAD superfamily hydrolase (TIGR01549 family)